MSKIEGGSEGRVRDGDGISGVVVKSSEDDLELHAWSIRNIDHAAK